MSERIAEAFWLAVLLVCLFSADQFLEAQPVSDKDEQSHICDRESKYFHVANGKRRDVPYSVIDGQDVVEGDIVIGQSDGPGYFPPVVPDYIGGQRTRWGNGIAPYVVPFVIDSSAEAYRSLIRDATAAWTSQSIKFVERNEKIDWRKENYVKFISGPTDVCRSNSVGVRKKEVNGTEEEKNINVVWVAGCGSWGSVAHEVGHVLGLGHEQSRKDRGDYITMLWGNIKDDRPPHHIDNYRRQYCQAIWDDQTLAKTDYDFDSIMHYPVNGFSKDPSDKSCEKVEDYKGKRQCLAFEPKPDKLRQQEQKLGRAIEIGQTGHLSLLDIAAVKTLYPDAPPPTKPPDPPTKAQPCSVVTETKITEGGVTTTTTRTEPCPDDQRPPVSTQCCHEKIVIPRPCYPGGCRPPPVKVSWPRPDRWCRSEWCRPWPRPRPLCERDGWIEGRPPFDDWDDRW